MPPSVEGVLGVRARAVACLTCQSNLCSGEAPDPCTDDQACAARGYRLRELFVLVATSGPFVSRHAEGT